MRHPKKPNTRPSQLAKPQIEKSQTAKPQTAKPQVAKPMSARAVRAFLEALAKANPDPRTELQYRDPFTLLLAVVLSAQATDVSVNRATAELFRVANTPSSIVKLGVDGLAPYIRSIGLWKTKAHNVVCLSENLLSLHGGEVPANREELEALPGVGRKTANVVLNVAFGQPTVAVDTHIFRVSNRSGLAPGSTPRAVEEALLQRVPAKMLVNVHHWLILHGRYVCKARRPECWHCVGARWCRYSGKTAASANVAGQSLLDHAT